MSSHFRFALSAFSLTLVFGLFAAAQSRPSASFAYTRGSGAEHCPDDTSLRNAVSARLEPISYETDSITTMTNPANDILCSNRY